ncbi:nol12 [Scenedesmus sp. PABB004]|nr:nol12 [Scenedesmus sp. PABB004]
MKSSLYRDYDALAFNPRSVGEERGAINHVKKAKARQRGLEVVFDPKAHREFVTGFRKRKQQRRKEAEKQNVKKAKEQRVQDRAERRKELKAQLGLPEDYGVHDSDGEQGGADPDAAAARAEVKQYSAGGLTTTVSVVRMSMGDSDDEPEPGGGSGSEAGDGEPQPGGGGQRPGKQARGQQQPPGKQSKKQLGKQKQHKGGALKAGKVAKKKKGKRRCSAVGACVSCAAPDEAPGMRAWLDALGTPLPVSVQLQSDDLGERMLAALAAAARVDRHARPARQEQQQQPEPGRQQEQQQQQLGRQQEQLQVQHEPRQPFAGAVVVGSDVPDLSAGVLRAAAGLLSGGACDVVLGPALDGGFYLLGLSAAALADPRVDAGRLFAGVAWSTDSVCDRTAAAARALGLRLAPPGGLPRLADVDTLPDLRAWWAGGGGGGAFDDAAAARGDGGAGAAERRRARQRGALRECVAALLAAAPPPS